LLQFEIIRAEPTFSSLPREEYNQKFISTRVDFVSIAEYYNGKIRAEKMRSAEQVMSVITQLVDHEGVYGMPGAMVFEDEEMQV
jgi:hypothetical protein